MSQPNVESIADCYLTFLVRNNTITKFFKNVSEFFTYCEETSDQKGFDGQLIMPTLICHPILMDTLSKYGELVLRNAGRAENFYSAH